MAWWSASPAWRRMAKPAGLSAVDVAVTLYDGGGNIRNVATRVRAENRSAPRAPNANLEPLVEGPGIRLAARHTKIRREGYRR